MAGESSTASTRARWSPSGLGALLALFVVALYWRAPLLGFAGDDALVIYHLKRLGGLTHPGAYFSALDFFTYYRPLGFLSFAVDAAIWGWGPAGFHLTNLALHVANTLLVFALARRIMSPTAAALAAAVFAAHVSNQEAVYWISARFDLLSTCGVLVTVLLTTRRGAGWPVAGMAAFAMALLSKEAALAAPILVGAYEVFVLRSRTPRVLAILGAMMVLVAGYAVSRSLVGGLDPTGGASRLPKAAALAALVAGLVVLSRIGWERLASRASRARAVPVATAGAVFLSVAACASLPAAAGATVRQLLSFAGFAGFYLASPIVAPAPPPFFLDPTTPIYWVGGLCAIAAVGALLFAARLRLAQDGRWLFIAAATAGALLPVSSLTEGQRYLYLASVGMSIAIAKAVVESAGRWRRPAAAGVALFAAASAWQIELKGADWDWASSMLSRGTALVHVDLPSCGEGDVVFVTAPVGVRGVYSHFYHQTFSQQGGCEPGSYRAVVRMVRTDQEVDVRWELPRTLVLRAPDYRGNFMLSADLRSFEVQQRARRDATLETPLGRVTSRPDGRAQIVTLDLLPTVDLGRTRFYYFSRGEVRRVAPPGGPPTQ